MSTDSKIRKATAVATTVVAFSSGVLSYAGLRNLALDAGFEPYLAILLPIAVDGLVIAGMIGVLHATLSKTSAAYSWFLVLAGLAFSVWGNATLADNPADKMVHGVAPIALALSLEALVATIRRKVSDDRQVERAAADEETKRLRAENRAARESNPPRCKASTNSKPRGSRSPEIEARIVELRGNGLTLREIETEVGLSRSTVNRILNDLEVAA